MWLRFLYFLTQAMVVVRADASDADAVAADLAQLATDAAAGGRFTGDADPVSVSEDGRTSVLRLAMPFAESDDRVDDALRELRSDLVPAAVDVPGAETAVGG
ncbi:MAG: hypothetical protein AABZ60_16415, partial [Planctomycetota bacterium]